MHTSSYGLAYLKGIGIEKPKDLEDRRGAWALENPRGAVDIFMKHNPGRKRSIISAQWKYMKRLSFDEHFDEDGLGYVNPGEMASALKLVEKHIGLKNPVKAEGLYTNRFVSRVPRKWRLPKPR